MRSQIHVPGALSLVESATTEPVWTRRHKSLPSIEPYPSSHFSVTYSGSHTRQQSSLMSVTLATDATNVSITRRRRPVICTAPPKQYVLSSGTFRSCETLVRSAEGRHLDLQIVLLSTGLCRLQAELQLKKSQFKCLYGYHRILGKLQWNVFYFPMWRVLMAGATCDTASGQCKYVWCNETKCEVFLLKCDDCNGPVCVLHLI
jgi:hypothetical protein